MGEELIAVDSRGRAGVCPLAGEVEEIAPLFDLRLDLASHGKGSRRLGRLLPTPEGWFLSIPYQPSHFIRIEGKLHRSSECREIELGLGLRADALVSISLADPYAILEWAPPQPPRPLFDVRGLVPEQDLAKDVGHLAGGVVLPDGERVLCWSSKLLFLWEAGRPPRLITDRSEIRNRGPTQSVDFSPDNDRFALMTRGSQVFLGSLSGAEPWTLLPVPPVGGFTHRSHHISSKTLVFAGHARLYAVATIGDELGTQLLAWDLSGAPRLAGHLEWDDHNAPLSLSASSSGDLVAVGLSSGEVRVLETAQFVR